MKSARAHFQLCTTTSVSIGHSRMRCCTAHSRWRFLVMLNFDWTFSGEYVCSPKTMNYINAGSNCTSSEVNVGSLQTINVKIGFFNCLETTPVAAHFLLMKNHWRMPLSSTVLMRDRAHSQWMDAIHVNVLRFRVTCVAARSKLWKQWSAI